MAISVQPSAIEPVRRGLTIIVAALNEEQNAEAAVLDITTHFGQLGWEFEILFFNDHSKDRTGEVAERLARTNPHLQVFHNERRLNIGGIYKAGVEKARYGYCLLLPGDNEVPVEEVVKGLQYLEKADLVVSYIANQESRPLLRRVLSRLYTNVVNWLFEVDFTYTNGSNICRTDLLRRIMIKTDGFSYQTEALLKLVRQGVDYIEFGIHIRPRAHGRSTALALRNWLKVGKALAMLWWDIRVVNRRLYAKVGKKLARHPSHAHPSVTVLSQDLIQ